MNNNPNKGPSNKKAILNFNADDWNVDMPIARHVVNTANPRMNANSVPKVAAANHTVANNFSKGSIPGVNSSHSVASVSTVPDNKKDKKGKKSTAWKIILIIIITALVIYGLVMLGYEMDLLSVTSDSSLTEAIGQLSDETVQTVRFI